MILHAGAQDLFGLLERGRDLLKTGDVILVVLDCVERNRERQVREAGVDAALRVDGHLIVFEVVVVDVLLHVAQEEIVRRPVFLTEAFGGDGFDPPEVALVDLVPPRDGRQRVVA